MQGTATWLYADQIRRLLGILAWPPLPKERWWKRFLRKCHLLKERDWLDAMKLSPEDAEKKLAKWQREMEQVNSQSRSWLDAWEDSCLQPSRSETDVLGRGET